MMMFEDDDDVDDNDVNDQIDLIMPHGDSHYPCINMYVYALIP